MSCYYEVYCLDCEVQGSIYGGGTDPYLETIQAIILDAPKLVAVAVVSAGCSNIRVSYEAQFQGEWRIDLAWFRIHGNHRLAPISEYGEIIGQCGKEIVCPHCQQRPYPPYCKRERGHAPPCSKEG